MIENDFDFPGENGVSKVIVGHTTGKSLRSKETIVDKDGGRKLN